MPGMRMSISTTSGRVSRTTRERASRRRPPPPRPRGRRVASISARRPPRISAWSSASTIRVTPGSTARTAKPPSPAAPALNVAAERRRALAHPGQPVALAQRRPRAAAVVAHLDLDARRRPRAPARAPARPRPRGGRRWSAPPGRSGSTVPPTSSAGRPSRLQLDVEARAAHVVDERPQVAGRRALRGVAVAQHVEHRADLGQRLAAEPPDRPQRLARRLVRRSRCSATPACSAIVASAVADDVVHVARDPQPLLRDVALGLLRARLLGQLQPRPPQPQRLAEQRRADEEDRRRRRRRAATSRCRSPRRP